MVWCGVVRIRKTMSGGSGSVIHIPKELYVRIQDGITALEGRIKDLEKENDQLRDELNQVNAHSLVLCVSLIR